MKYNTDTCAIELTVKELCELTLPSGDIGGTFASDISAMANITDIYKRLQAEAEGYYNTDVELSGTVSFGGIYYTVSGKAGGVIRGADGYVCVDQIKCVRGYEFFSSPKELDLAQMKCYAYLLCVRDSLESVRCRLSYYNADTKKTKYFNYRLSAEALKKYYYGLVEKLEWIGRLEIARVTDGLPSAAAVRFPYPQLREGQEMMIREGYSALKRGKRVFMEAPTGTGKTVSSLYPAVRALGEGHVDKIFYLTAKASTRREAYLAAAKLYEGGAKLRTVVITAKDQICPMRGAVSASGGKNLCNGVDCPYARGYYDRVTSALRDILEDKNGYPRGLICQIAEKHCVCPYELSLDLSEYCDIVICDYNYAFDPCVYFRRYFSDGGVGMNYAFLVDEAHNLADRARDMYSADLKLSELLELRRVVGAVSEELRIAADGLIMATERLKKLCREDITKDADGNDQGFYMSHTPLENYNKELESFKRKCDGWLKKNRDHPVSGDILELSSSVRRYLAVNEFFDRGFLCYVELYGGDITVKTYCLDPSPTMNMLLRKAKGTVLFSATLTPTEYFCDVLGGSKNAETISLPSPFDPKNLCVTVVDGISVRSEDRKKNYSRYATVIAATVAQRHGNYIAYFPSYECLEGVLEIFKKKHPRVETVVQSRGMGAAQKESFLSAFQNDEGHLRIGFCVLGGAFSEGVDLPGSRLIGSIIFGVGIPALSNERNIIREYFDNTIGMGYEYAYTYPGMNRVLQAVGRVIRRDGDKGVAVLVDDRYAEPKYRALFPKHWEGIQYTANARSLAEIIHRFWDGQGNCE